MNFRKNWSTYSSLKRYLKTVQELQDRDKSVKKNNLIYYSTGVKQGDNIAPILFIIVMQFLAELLEKKWRENNIYMPHFNHDSNDSFNKGHLISHNIKKRF